MNQKGVLGTGRQFPRKDVFLVGNRHVDLAVVARHLHALAFLGVIGRRGTSLVLGIGEFFAARHSLYKRDFFFTSTGRSL